MHKIYILKSSNIILYYISEYYIKPKLYIIYNYKTFFISLKIEKAKNNISIIIKFELKK